MFCCFFSALSGPLADSVCQGWTNHPLIYWYPTALFSAVLTPRCSRCTPSCPTSREYLWSPLCYLSVFLTSLVWGELSHGHCGTCDPESLNWAGDGEGACQFRGWNSHTQKDRCWQFEGTQSSWRLAWRGIKAFCLPTPQAPYLLRGDRWAQEPLSFTHPQYGSLEAIQVLRGGKMTVSYPRLLSNHCGLSNCQRRNTYFLHLPCRSQRPRGTFITQVENATYSEPLALSSSMPIILLSSTPS